MLRPSHASAPPARRGPRLTTGPSSVRGVGGVRFLSLVPVHASPIPPPPVSDLRDAKAALRWAISTAVALGENCDAAMVQLAMERDKTAKTTAAASSADPGVEPSPSETIVSLEARCIELQAAISAHAVVGCKLGALPQQPPLDASGGGDGATRDVVVLPRADKAVKHFVEDDSGAIVLAAEAVGEPEDDERDDEDGGVDDDEDDEQDSDFSADEGGRGQNRKRPRGAVSKKQPRSRAAAVAPNVEGGLTGGGDELLQPEKPRKKEKTAHAPSADTSDGAVNAHSGPCACGKTSTCTRCPCKAAGRACGVECQCNKVCRKRAYFVRVL